MSKPYAGSLLEAAATLARLTANTAMQWYRRPLDVDRKDDGSPVTIADREAERVAREWLALHFAGDGVIGEEFGAVNPEAPRRWILDPIDGTKAFIRGVPLWGSLVACTEGERVLAGAACFPVVDELVAAAPGEGCWWNGVRTHVSSIASIGEATVLITDERFPEHPSRGVAWRGLAAEARVARTWGDCYGYLLVATGRAEVMVDDIVNPWDAAALQPIIEEAGGVFTDFRGAATAFGGDAIATNAALGAYVRTKLVTDGLSA